VMSVGPPAGNAMNSLIGLAGKLWAWTVKAGVTTAAAASWTSWRRFMGFAPE
jgi:hypothetical protein